MQPPRIIKHNHRPRRQVRSREMQRGDRTVLENTAQLVQGSSGRSSQRSDDLAAEADQRAALASQEGRHNGSAQRVLDELRRYGNAILWPAERRCCGWGEQCRQRLDGHRREGAAAAVVRSEDMQREEPRRGVLIAAVCVPGEIAHGFRAGLVCRDLSGDGGGCRAGPHVPEPAAGGTMRYWQAVAVVLVQTGYQRSEVVALGVGKAQTDLEDARLGEMMGDGADVLRLRCVGWVRGCKVRNSVSG